MNLMMLYSIIMVTAATVLLLANRSGQFHRWGAAFFICASFGGIAEEIRTAFLSADPSGNHTAYVIYAILFAVNLIVTPYFALWFGIAYAEKDKLPRRSIWQWISLLPIAGILGFTDFTPEQPEAPAVLLGVIACAYYLGAAWLFLQSALWETQPRLKRNRIFTALAVIPTLVAVVICIYIVPIFQPSFNFFSYIGWFIAYSFVIGIAFSIHQGMLGVRIRVEGSSLEQSVKTAHTGAAFLNHSVKNDIGKIRLAAANMGRLGSLNERQLDQLSILQRSADHLLEMSQRILSQLRDMEWEERTVQLKALLLQVLSQSKINTKMGDIQVELQIDERYTILADPVHLSEVLTNVIRNALEAMEPGGRLTMSCYLGKRALLLQIKDTGEGMSKEQLECVFEPYYSTKSSESNYGLGLTYCYQVLRKAGIGMEIDSLPRRGTTVTLRFPISKVAAMQE